MVKSAKSRDFSGELWSSDGWIIIHTLTFGIRFDRLFSHWPRPNSIPRHKWCPLARTDGIGKKQKSVHKDFDCTDCIIENYSSLRSLGRPAVYSIWDQNASSSLLNVKTVVSSIEELKSLLSDPNPSQLRPFYQIFTLYKGLLAIHDEVSPDTWILKIRTDFNFPWQIWEGYIAEKQFDPDTIYIPYFLKHRALALADFYWFGTYKGCLPIARRY